MTTSVSRIDAAQAQPHPHPRTLGWVGTTALAMGGSNQCLFILAALFIGQDQILGQGSAAIPLLAVGLLLAWASAPGWIELVLMFPNRVGGISASCAEAFRPYSPILANLTGVCYWWGWVPTCGLTALLSASAIHAWYLPAVPVPVLATGFVLAFTLINLLGIKSVTRLAMPIAGASALLAFVSGLAPIVMGQVDWHQATTFHLTTPFDGWFGGLTSLMAGLYLIGFAAPAFEAAACHVGETIDPNRNLPKAMLASGLLAGVYFLLLPVVWLGTLGAEPLGRDLALVLGPTFAPLFGNAAKSAAVWFMVLSMFSGTLQPLAGASRALSQLSEDGLLPRLLALRSRADVPWVATLLTAAMSILFLLIGDPIWLVAAANFTYLIGIALPSVAVWLLRRDAPQLPRPYRAPRGAIRLGLGAAVVWGLSALLGFEQFGLTTVLIGLAFAYSGSALYAWRRYDDRKLAGLPGMAGTLQIKLTGAMLLVLILDGAGYLLAVNSIPTHQSALMTGLSDIFVAVAMLSITVALVLPGMIAHSAMEVSAAAKRLASGTLAEFSKAMQALGRGDLDDAYVHVDNVPVRVGTRDEVGEMAASFNALQAEVGLAANGLAEAREGLRRARDELTHANAYLEQRVLERTGALERANVQLEKATAEAEQATLAKSSFLATMSHEIRTPMNGVIGMVDVLAQGELAEDQVDAVATIRGSAFSLLGIIDDILDFSKIEAGRLDLECSAVDLGELAEKVHCMLAPVAAAREVYLAVFVHPAVPMGVLADSGRLRQILFNLVGNAIKFSAGRPETLGRVSLRVEVDDPLPLRVRFSIVDNGIGIAPPALANLFMPFVQAESSTTRRFGGTGLGLTICKRLVELMQGEIDVTSRPGAGSTFVVTLPFEVVAGEPARVGPDLSGVDCIVLASPDIDARDLAAHLEQAGSMVRRGADVASATAIAERLTSGSGRTVVAVYSGDHGGRLAGPLPPLPGLRQVRIARSRVRLAAPPPGVVALDADGLKGSSLLRAVAVAAGRAALHAGGHDPVAKLHRAAAPSVAVARAQGRLVLVAEDDEINQKVLLRQLSLLGYAAEMADNGAQALLLWRSGHYALLLSDLHMPELDGYSLARAIRAEESLRSGAAATRLPILALTANAMQESAARVRAAGMDECMTKPIQLLALDAALRRWMPVGSSAPPGALAAAPP